MNYMKMRVKMTNNGMKKTMLVLALIFGLAAIYYYNAEPTDEPIEETKPNECDSNNIWIPTKDDIAYQDSMYNIIIQTQSDVDTIKDQMRDIIIKLDRIDYEDGTYDSIRIVSNKNKENQSR
jgi:hypothetical protein